MKIISLFNLLLFLLLTFASCVEEDGSYCKYSGRSHGRNDSTLFISFKIDNDEYLLFQGARGFVNNYDTISLDDNSEMIYYHESVCFGPHISDDTPISSLYSMSFWIKVKHNKSELVDFPIFPKIIQTFNSYTYPPDNAQVSDTIFTFGVSIDDGDYSTENVMQYFEYNVDLINAFFYDTYFTINSVEPVCDDNFLVSGTFSTKLLHDYQPNDFKIIKDGKFQFVIK